MDALELAMKMGKDGENFYRQLADKATNSGFREIYSELADDEVKHYQLFKGEQYSPESFKETKILRNARDILKQMFIRDGLRKLDISQLELHQAAMEHAKARYNFYLTISAEKVDRNQRELFQRVAAEEEKHCFLLHNIFELMSVKKQISQMSSENMPIFDCCAI